MMSLAMHLSRQAPLRLQPWYESYGLRHIEVSIGEENEEQVK